MAIQDAPAVRPIPFAEEPYGRFKRAFPWIAAWVVTLALHGGLSWFLMHETATAQPPITKEPVAVMIDMVPEVQQSFAQSDAAVGPPMKDAAETLPPEDPKPDPTPLVEQSPTEAVAPLPAKPPEKPNVEKKRPSKPKTPSKKPSAKAPARTASAPRANQQAQRTTVTLPGAANAAAAADWKSQVSAALNRNKRYPAGAAAYGSPTIRMTIAASGSVGGVGVIVSSGSSELDDAAVETVRRSSPLPPPPGGETTLTFRMNFRRR